MSKPPHRYGWDDEPRAEQPSEFFSTGFSSVSGFHASMSPARPAPRRKPKGLGVVAIFTATLLGIGGGVLYAYAPRIGAWLKPLAAALL